MTEAPERIYNPNELLTKTRASREYGIGRTELWLAEKSGELPVKILGRRAKRIRREDMDAYVRSLPDFKPPESLEPDAMPSNPKKLKNER